MWRTHVNAIDISLIHCDVLSSLRLTEFWSQKHEGHAIFDCLFFLDASMHDGGKGQGVATPVASVSQASACEPRRENAHICQHAAHDVGANVPSRQPPVADAKTLPPLLMPTYVLIVQHMGMTIASGLTIHLGRAHPPPAESNGPRQGASTTRDRAPLGKVLSGLGSPTTARPSGTNRGCQPRSPGELGLRKHGLGSHTVPVWGSPEDEWPGGPAS